MGEELEIRCVEVGMFQGNCYLVKCNKAGHGVIIDPGDEPDRIRQEVRNMKLEPEAILLTHGHIDHANAAGALRKAFRCRVVCHPSDSEMLSGEEPTLWGLQRNPCTVDQEIADGETIAVGDQRFKVIHTPGHTKGSVCYMVDSILFSGDTLFSGSIGRTDLPGGSDREMSRTLKTRIATLDVNTVVHPGHGPSTTIEHEKQSNPFL
jgi:glyoxylase-like metal-dependent hydrolase (beta-lactamase superfamily II)